MSEHLYGRAHAAAGTAPSRPPTYRRVCEAMLVIAPESTAFAITLGVTPQSPMPHMYSKVLSPSLAAKVLSDGRAQQATGRKNPNQRTGRKNLIAWLASHDEKSMCTEPHSFCSNDQDRRNAVKGAVGPCQQEKDANSRRSGTLTGVPTRAPEHRD